MTPQELHHEYEKRLGDTGVDCRTTEALCRAYCHDYLRRHGPVTYYAAQNGEGVEVMTKRGRVHGEGKTIHEANWQVLDHLRKGVFK